MVLKLITSSFGIENKLTIYKQLLLKWSPRLNLVSKNTLDDTDNRHFKDSEQLIPFLKHTDKIVDIGSGAGFPGMILAMHGFDVTLVESDQKKCVFLENVSRETNTPVNIVCGRVEKYKPLDLFDIVCSRGVAPLLALIQLSSHLVKKGSSFGLFLKGKQVNSELLHIDFSRIKKIPSVTELGSFVIYYQY